LARVVLVVDDEPLVLEVTETMLKDLGCEVVTAPGANEALEKLSTDRRIEVLITDINMPGMDGYELARAAVRMRKRLKVIVLSGRETEGCGSFESLFCCGGPRGNDETHHRSLLTLLGGTELIFRNTEVR
jgi:CheY-like chemotaxis protein